MKIKLRFEICSAILKRYLEIMLSLDIQCEMAAQILLRTVLILFKYLSISIRI